jgi:hypothetical protein
MSENSETRDARFDPTTVAITAMAAALWLIVLLVVGKSHKVDAGITLLALTGITIAMQRLLRGLRNSWPLAAWLAPVIALCSLAVAAFLTPR